MGLRVKTRDASSSTGGYLTTLRLFNTTIYISWSNQSNVSNVRPQVLPTTTNSNHSEMVWNHTNRFYSDAVLAPRLGRGAKVPRQQVRKLKTIENTTSELHRTSKIIQKVFLSRNLHEFEENWKMVNIFWPKSYKNLEIQVDLRSDNDIQKKTHCIGPKSQLRSQRVVRFWPDATKAYQSSSCQGVV